jgi:hypothetical protein
MVRGQVHTLANRARRRTKLLLYDVPARQGVELAGPPPSPPRTGFLPLSFLADVEAMLSRLAALGLGSLPRRVIQLTPSGPITTATVCDPGALLVLTTPGPIARGA